MGSAIADADYPRRLEGSSHKDTIDVPRPFLTQYNTIDRSSIASSILDSILGPAVEI
jgi:hypothetical protein